MATKIELAKELAKLMPSMFGTPEAERAARLAKDYSKPELMAWLVVKSPEASEEEREEARKVMAELSRRREGMKEIRNEGIIRKSRGAAARIYAERTGR